MAKVRKRSTDNAIWCDACWYWVVGHRWKAHKWRPVHWWWSVVVWLGFMRRDEAK